MTTKTPQTAARSVGTRTGTRRTPREAPVPPVPAPADLELSALAELAVLDAELDRDQRVRRIAWHLFEQRGCLDGGAVDDWLQAEALVDAAGSGDLQAQASARGGH